MKTTNITVFEIQGARAHFRTPQSRVCVQGHSLGAVVAFELCKVLRTFGHLAIVHAVAQPRGRPIMCLFATPYGYERQSTNLVCKCQCTYSSLRTRRHTFRVSVFTCAYGIATLHCARCRRANAAATRTHVPRKVNTSVECEGTRMSSMTGKVLMAECVRKVGARVLEGVRVHV